MGLIEIAKKTGRGLALTAALFAAGSLAAAPSTAYARDWHGGGHWGGGHWGGHHHGGGGAGIALGLIGGALAGAAIASAANTRTATAMRIRPTGTTRTDRTTPTDPASRRFSKRAALSAARFFGGHWRP
jgi:hypothetical protein